MTQKIYLTIDDSPSVYMTKKVDFLIKNKIPALFYCRGESIPQLMDSVIYAIHKGFLIGNHSFSHPHFSKISYEECVAEILKTEDLINDCYQKAGVNRSVKAIRLPFGDRGIGDPEKANKIQKFLKDQGFQRGLFEGALASDPCIDAFWTWDSFDYKKKFIENADLFLQQIQDHFKSINTPEVILLHDFDESHSLFLNAVNFLIDQKCEFCVPNFCHTQINC